MSYLILEFQVRYSFLNFDVGEYKRQIRTIWLDSETFILLHITRK